MLFSDIKSIDFLQPRYVHFFTNSSCQTLIKKVEPNTVETYLKKCNSRLLQSSKLVYILFFMIILASCRGCQISWFVCCLVN
ncbi:unnamed protein product [Moneuplotes crassus]|uniref:Uncharacterized protein n=1 Tax=Euplotes crassus TaxID=5936 RepID=A0AAD2D7R5_EUPCR|nr:unnamed protein product [Moneuplotes crassus]